MKTHCVFAGPASYLPEGNVRKVNWTVGLTKILEMLFKNKKENPREGLSITSHGAVEI
jgi:hypothetical protein